MVDFGALKRMALGGGSGGGASEGKARFGAGIGNEGVVHTAGTGAEVSAPRRCERGERRQLQAREREREHCAAAASRAERGSGPTFPSASSVRSHARLPV
jgi:hypothetical protein